MLDLLSPQIPDRATLRQIREGLGLSQAEFATILGFRPNGAQTVRRWETEDDFKPTNTLWQAIRYLVMVVETYKSCPPGEKRDKLAALLPDSLK